jgi:hypothetical protein
MGLAKRKRHTREVTVAVFAAILLRSTLSGNGYHEELF